MMPRSLETIGWLWGLVRAAEGAAAQGTLTHRRLERGRLGPPAAREAALGPRTTLLMGRGRHHQSPDPAGVKR